jgi:ectoine hydroxylase-related dioxygenase (phytanoyl-CoA dioxygenase family)
METNTLATLPALASPYPATPEQVGFFAQNGYLYLPQVATAQEVAAYRPAINGAVQHLNTETRKMEDRDTYGKAFLQTMNLWRHDAAVQQYVMAQRFAGLAARLLGVERVRLYHDQALYKEPGGGKTPWHQDQYYWPMDTDRTITMWMPLIDLTDDMGILTFAGQSHRKGFLENLPISDQSQAVLEDYVHQQGYPVWRPTQMRAGDATFHAGWTLHFAPGNTSGTMREVMTIIYFADGAKITQPANLNQEQDRQTWFLGLEPGQLAASEINPVLG